MISPSGPWNWLISDKCPGSNHSSTDRQNGLDPLVLDPLSSLDINKMASKNLFYINRTFFKIGQSGVFENFILVKISPFDIPKFRIHFGTVHFRTCLEYIWIKVGIFWNLFWFELKIWKELLKVNSTNSILLCKPKFIFFSFGPFLIFFKHIFMVPIIRKKCEMFIIILENHFLNSQGTIMILFTGKQSQSEGLVTY